MKSLRCQEPAISFLPVTHLLPSRILRRCCICEMATASKTGHRSLLKNNATSGAVQIICRSCDRLASFQNLEMSFGLNNTPSILVSPRCVPSRAPSQLRAWKSARTFNTSRNAHTIAVLLEGRPLKLCH